MAEDRTVGVWALVAAHAASRARRVSVADVCGVAVTSAQVSGGWVTAGGSPGPEFVGMRDRLGQRAAR
jgi:hypothetical protein